MNQTRIDQLREGVPADLHHLLGEAEEVDSELCLDNGDDPLVKFFAETPLDETSQQSPSLTAELLGDDFDQSQFLKMSASESHSQASEDLGEDLFGDQPQSEFIKAAQTQIPTGGTAPTRSGQTPGVPRPVTPPPTRKTSAVSDELIRLMEEFKDDNHVGWQAALKKIKRNTAVDEDGQPIVFGNGFSEFVFAIDSGDVRLINNSIDGLASEISRLD